MIHLDGHPIGFHIDAFLQPKKWTAGSREGIWWLPRDTATDYLILTNTADKQLNARLLLRDAGGKSWQQNVLLGARQTLRLSARTLLEKAHLTGAYGGITVEVATGIAFLDTLHVIVDEVAGSSAVMKMFDRDPQATLAERSWGGLQQWTLRAPMLALTHPDGVLGFPADTQLQPQIFFRNASARPQSIQVHFNWRATSATGKTQVIPISLKPYQTLRLDVGGLQVQNMLPMDAPWASVFVTAAGIQPDQLLAVAASYDKTGRYGSQTPFNDQLAPHWEGNQWQVDETHNSLITVGNGGTKPTRAKLTFLHNNGKDRYEIERLLAPEEQIWIDVAQLVRNQIPDKNGHTLPPGQAAGTYRLEEPGNDGIGSLFEGKLILDKTFGESVYGCMVCCAPAHGLMDFDPLAVAVGGDEFQGISGPDACTGEMVPMSGSYTTWSTSDTSIAMAAMNKIHGVGPGSTSIRAVGQITWGDGQEARRCPVRTDTALGGADVAKLTCTASVARGGSASCTVTPSTGVTVSDWKFVGGGATVTRTGTGATSLSWSGVMAIGGTVSVSATMDGVTIPLSRSITVDNRANFAFTAVAASKRANPYSAGACNIGVPTSPAAGNAVGYSCLDQQFFETPYLIGDNGPNHGFRYVYSASNTYNNVPTTFNFVIAGYLDDSGSEFAQKQCGNYNPNTNTGYISYTQLKFNTYEHESGNTTGHYATYKSTQDNPAINIGVVVEAVVGPPGQSESAFNQQVVSLASSKGSAITSAAFPVPETLTTFCNSDVRKDPSCVFRGFINWPVYASCQ